MEDARRPLVGQREHPGAGEAREARRGDAVDRVALPDREPLPRRERGDDRVDEVTEAGVLIPRCRPARPVDAEHARDACHDRPVRALQRHQLARRLEHAVVVDRVRGRRLVGHRLRAVEDPVGRDRDERRARLARDVGERARDADVGLPRAAAVGVDAREVVPDRRVHDCVGPDRRDRVREGVGVEEVENDVAAAGIRAGRRRPHDRRDAIPSFARSCSAILLFWSSK